MAVFTCKMCGGSLEFAEGTSVGTCEYCGRQQTLPRLNDEKIANLYDRAGHFRRAAEFDKAASTYEKILNEDPTDAEAYWSLVLCRYGIEYVEDPQSKKRVPTVNRTQMTSVFDDENYKAALSHADAAQKALYEEQAQEINEIQKGVLALAEKEDPFDVFICYKETDSAGKRTPDSVLANDLYHALTDEGFKVFYAAITLEDMLGSEYEPYIFAALNSARVMVVLGTRPEYFVAPWVKNEWHRFLAISKQSEERRLLIPAYRDMDPYDLPEEFSHLQAQDMSKIGFVQDLVRGIRKVITGAAPAATAAPVANSGMSVSEESLLKRAFLFLEDGDFGSANKYVEKVLDVDPECAPAYLAKMFSELRVKREDDLRSVKDAFDQNPNFVKALRFAKGDYRAKLESFVESRLMNFYTEGKKTMDAAEDDGAYRAAAEIFDVVGEYKDAVSLAETCRARASDIVHTREQNRLKTLYENAQNIMASAATGVEYDRAAEAFVKAGDYLDAVSMARLCRTRAHEAAEAEETIRLEGIYQEATSLLQTGKTPQDYARAEELFESISRYKDAEKLAKRAAKKKLGAIRTQNFLKKLKRFLIKAGIVAAIVIAIVFFVNKGKSDKYQRGLDAKEAGDYETAISCFAELGDYKDAKDLLVECQYYRATNYMESGLYTEAIATFRAMDSYEDSISLLAECVQTLSNARLAVPGGETQTPVSIGVDSVIALQENGALKTLDVELTLAEWSDVVSVSMREVLSWGSREAMILGLKSDGTVYVASNYECDVTGWTNMIAVAAGRDHAVGLKLDGTVVAAGDNSEGECNVPGIANVVAISAGQNYTLCLKEDGTVVAFGDNSYGQCDVSEWTDIVAISAGVEHALGLRSDGTVVATGNTDEGRCDVGGWTNVVAISAGTHHSVAIRADGVGISTYCEGKNCTILEGFTDLVAIEAGSARTIGVKADGTIVAASDSDYEEINVSEWPTLRVPKKPKEETPAQPE